MRGVVRLCKMYKHVSYRVLYQFHPHTLYLALLAYPVWTNFPFY